MNAPRKPCDGCKRKPNCPVVCFPLKDWKRAMEKRGLEWDTQRTSKAW